MPGGVCCAFARSLSTMLRDGDELDFERIADEHFVEQHVAAGVVVAVDEAGHDRHLPWRRRSACSLPTALDLVVRPTAMKRPPFTANASARGMRESTV